MAEPADINVDELRRRARRRLVGAVVLALAVAVIVPMLLESQPKPLGDDVSVKIPPVDDGKFVNRLSGSAAGATKASEATGSPASPAEPVKGAATDTAPAVTSLPAAAPAAVPVSAAAPMPAPTEGAKPPKYDTHVPDAPGDGARAGSPAPAPASASAPAPAPASPSPSLAAAGGHDKSVAAGPVASHPAAAAKPAPAVAAVTAAKATTPAHAAGSAPEGFAVQLAAFSDDKGASALAHRLKNAGYSAYTEPLKTSKGTLWRVRVGPYVSRQAALAARDKLKREGHSGIVAPPR